MNRMASGGVLSRRWAIGIATALAAVACATSEVRDPQTRTELIPGFAAAGIADIAVLPVESSIPEETRPGAEFTFPEEDARREMRRFLIAERDYASPTIAWVDSREPVEFDTDAILGLTVTQWDTAALETRGVLYAGGRFELREAASRRVLWSHECSDVQILVGPRRGGYLAADQMREASHGFVREALARLPDKNDP